jgi:GT2 family glycosyltransferase
VAGLNAGIAAGSSKYVALLNDDTEPETVWLEELVACAERRPEAGSIASKLRLASDRGKLHSAGDSYSVRAMPVNRGVWRDDLGQYDAEEEVFSACGGAALYRREALEAVRRSDGQVFDQRLFMYCEDVDLAWRLQLADWRCVYAPAAVVYHHLSATGGGTLASYYVSRNIWLVYARTIPRRLLRPYHRRIIAFHGGRLWRTLLHIREPAARAALRGTLSGLATVLSTRPFLRPLSESETRRIMNLLDQS